jgi:hypothetical protein
MTPNDNIPLWLRPEAERRVLWEVTGYDPSDEQRIAHLAPNRIKLVAGGERGGKSRWTAAEITAWVAELCDGLIWIVGPDYEQARAEFRYVLDDLSELGILDADAGVATPNVGGWRCFTDGGTEISTRSANDPTTLASRAPDGVAMVEAAQQAHESYLRCRGRVAEKRGPLVLSGTFEGSMGWYADTYTLWQADNEDGARSFSLPTWSNRAIYPGGRDDPEIKALGASTPADLFQERYGAVPCPPATLVFREFDPKRHVSTAAEFDPTRPVQLWIDPGYAHPYAVLAVQRVPGTDGDNVNQIDEIWVQGVVAPQIIEQCKARVWWPNVKALVMDVAGKQHPGADSQSEIWQAATGLPVVMNPIPIVDGILRHRTYLIPDALMGRPKLMIHPRCRGSVWEYSHYQYSEDSEHRAATEVPIDRNNDAMKATAYGLYANFGPVVLQQEPSRSVAQVHFARK